MGLPGHPRRGLRAAIWTACFLTSASPVLAAFGERDCSFGTGGTQTIPGVGIGTAFSFAVEPSGHILMLVGYMSAGANLVRIDASGATSAILTGMATVGVVDPAIVVLGDGRILLLNAMDSVSRHLPTGALDTTFGNNGKASLAGFTRVTAGPIVQPDGKILVGGVFNAVAAVVRFLANGTPDASFGTGGAVATPSSGALYLSLALQPDGRILAASPTALVRYKADGGVDTAFGAGGTVSLVEVLPGSAVSANSHLKVQPSGKILVLGERTSDAGPRLLRIARFEPSGTLDATVGGGAGYRDVVAPAGPLFGFAASVPLTLQPDGRPIIVGNVGECCSGAIVRYGVDLTDDAIVPLDLRPAAAFVLPGGQLLLGLWGYDPQQEAVIQKRLGDLDAATCVATSTAVSTSPNPSRFGEPVTLTAVVSPASGSEVPTGPVQFSGDGSSLGSQVALSGGTAILATSSLAEGPHTITAAYAGGSGFAGSTSPPATHTVTPRPPSATTLSSSPNPSATGQAVTLTATVTPVSGLGPATGTVEFRADGWNVAAPVPLTGGAATLTTSTLGVGTRTLTAAYSGDAALAPSTSPPLTHVVLAGVAILDVSAAEGSAQNAVFRVTLSPPAFNSTVTVAYSTADGTAIAGQDYVATAGTLTFTPGRTVHSISVPIVTDAVAEGNETFTVTLANPVNASLARATATGTIADPPAPAIVPMYRAYNPYADYHFFTVSLAEFDNAVANGYRDESHPPCCTIPFHVPNTHVDGAFAIFRMYNPNNGRHYYTASAYERDSLRDVGWVYEKDEGFLFPTLETGTTEVFRLYNKNSGVHLYTADAGEKDTVLATFPGIWFQHTSLGYAFAQP